MRIVGSHTALSEPNILSLGRLLKACELRGKASLARLVSASSEPSFALQLHTAAAAAGLSIPLIATATGPAERLSRLLNSTLTPVTCPPLPGVERVLGAERSGEGDVGEAREQVSTVGGVLAARMAAGFLPSKQFYLFGKPTQHSPSPAIHTSGFEANGCCHTYALAETDSVEEVLSLLRAPTTGGGSVTIPLKEVLVRHMDTLSESARRR